MATPKSGSTSLTKWLVETDQIYGPSKFRKARVENNLLWKPIDNKIIRNETGFYLSDQQILELDDTEYLNECKRALHGNYEGKIYSLAKSVFYMHIPYMPRLYRIRYPNTKILITIRNPVDRLRSNYLYFIGDERTKLQHKYGDINIYLQYVRNHELLVEPFRAMLNELTIIDGMDYKQFRDIAVWRHVFMHYNQCLVNAIKVCKQIY